MKVRRTELYMTENSMGIGYCEIHKAEHQGKCTQSSDGRTRQWHPARASELSRTPKYSFSEAVTMSGASWIFLRNWLDRKWFPFDADRYRSGRTKHRRFSERDIELIRRTWLSTRPPATVKEAAFSIDQQLADFNYAQQQPPKD